MPAQPRVENGYRVFWDVGWWLDYADADEALDLYLGLSRLPAFQEDIRRPRIYRVRGGAIVLRDDETPPRGGRPSCSGGGAA